MVLSFSHEAEFGALKRIIRQQREEEETAKSDRERSRPGLRPEQKYESRQTVSQRRKDETWSCM